MSQQNSRSNPYQGLTLPQVLTTMLALLAEEIVNHFRMGLLYNYVLDSTLLEGTKYKSAIDFICSNISEVPRSSLTAYGVVARVFEEPVCVKFGFSRLQLLLTYKKLAKIELNHQEPGGTFIMLATEGGELKPKLFSDCTVDELRGALARLRDPVSHEPIPAEARASYDMYREAILARFAGSSLPVRVQLRNRGGKAVMNFMDIPVDQVSTLTEVLVDQLDVLAEQPEQEAPQQQAM